MIPEGYIYYTLSIYAKGYIVFVFLFCSLVYLFILLSIVLEQSFILKFLKWGISHQPLRKHLYLTIDTLEGQPSFHDSWPQDPCPRVGLEVKSRTHFIKKCSSTFMLWKQLTKIVGQTWLDLVTLTCGSGPLFHGPVTLPYILKAIWCMNIIVRDYESDVWLKRNVAHCDLYFMVHWFCLISRRLFDVWTSYFGIMSQYDIMFDLKINVGHCELYFIIHWFCLISWRLCVVWTSYFAIMSRFGPAFALIVTYFMVHWFCLLSWRLFVTYEHHTSKLWVVITRRLTQNKCRSLWPIFHGSVIFPFILKTVWCMNIIIWDYESVWPDIWPKEKCRSLWPVFHGQVILPYISKTIWWMSVVVSDNKTVWPKLWPQNKYRSTWPIFHDLVVLLNIFKIIWWMKIIGGIMDQCDAEIDLIKYL